MFLFQVYVTESQYQVLYKAICEHGWDTLLKDGQYWPYLVFTDDYVGGNTVDRGLHKVKYEEALGRICQQQNHIMIKDAKVYFTANGIKIGKHFISYDQLDQIYCRYLNIKAINYV